MTHCLQACANAVRNSILLIVFLKQKKYCSKFADGFPNTSFINTADSKWTTQIVSCPDYVVSCHTESEIPAKKSRHLHPRTGCAVFPRNITNRVVQFQILFAPHSNTNIRSITDRRQVLPEQIPNHTSRSINARII